MGVFGESSSGCTILLFFGDQWDDLWRRRQRLARRLGENGRRRVEREFAWEQVGSRQETLLTEVAAR